MYVSQRTVMNWRCNILGHHLRRSQQELSHLFWGCWSSNDFESKCHDLRTFFQGLVANLKKTCNPSTSATPTRPDGEFCEFYIFLFHFYFLFFLFIFFLIFTYFLNCEWQHETLFLKLLEVQTRKSEFLWQKFTF